MEKTAIGITIEDWHRTYQKLPRVAIGRNYRTNGTFKAVTGGMSLFAKVTLQFSRNSELIFESELDKAIEARALEEKWIHAAAVGVLDTMLVRPLTAITVFRCTFLAIEYHEIDSRPIAFQMAGRCAALELLKQEDYATYR